VAATVIRMPLPVGGQQNLPEDSQWPRPIDGQFATGSEESTSGRASAGAVALYWPPVRETAK
jgi:hypothetical protein